MKSTGRLFYLMLVVALFALTGINSAFGQSAPTLDSPTGGVGSCDDPNVIFSWTAPVSGTVTNYGIYISQTSATGSEILNYFGISPTSTTFSYAVPRSLDPYFWRVSASFTDLSHLYSTAATFTTYSPFATMYTPSNNMQCVPIDGIASWGYPTTATQYNLEINTSSTFDPGSIIYTGSTASTTFSLTGIVNYNTQYYWRLNTEVAGCLSGWSPGRTFTTVPDKPTITFPVHGSTCAPRLANFTWTSAPPADFYKLEVYNSPNFIPANRVYNNVSITSNSQTVSLPNYLSTYYSRVSASFTYGCSSDWSTTTTFTTSQPEPVPLLPPNFAEGVPFNTSCSWTPVPGATTYSLQVADNPDFTAPDVNQTGISSTSYTIALPTIKSNTVFYWRVASVIGGCNSMWSSTFTFKTPYDSPTLTSPINHRTCTPLNYRFQWNAATGATAFRIQIAKDAGFTNIVVNQDNIMDLYFDVSALEPLTNYYWRVRGEDINNTGLWSTAWDFETNIPAPALLEPANNSGGYQRTIDFSWVDILPNAEYTFQLSTDPNFGTSIVNVTGLTSSTYTYTVPTLNEDYYWRVSATFTPCSSTWSDTWTFRTVLNAPNLLSPANHATNQPVQLLCQWQPVPGATNYEFNLSNTANFSTILRGFVTSSTNYLLTDALDPETKYYWRVNAKNSEGVSDWSTVWDFNTVKQGPGVPVLFSPASGAEQIPTTITLRWLPSQSVNNYHLQVGTVVVEDTIILGPLYDLNTLTSTTYTLNDLDNFRTYYWHVSAINDSGETRYSSTWHFRVIDVLPLAPDLQAPVKNFANFDTLGTLYWFPATSNSVVEYQVQVATSASFTADSLVIDNPSTYNTSMDIDGLDWGGVEYFWRVKGTNEAGSGPWSETWNFMTKLTGVDDGEGKLFGITAYPNPTSESSLIHFNLPVDNRVVIKITNSFGDEIQTLLDRPMSAGEHNINWTAKGLSSGVYWYTVQIGSYKSVNKLVLVK
ncbi:MAG: T9SS type A sorting domain-containing protein [Ignavibacteriae bacterium]|nr:T9SS type A sorting domain-containing protein [Ignavibacteriota bacterium]